MEHFYELLSLKFEYFALESCRFQTVPTLLTPKHNLFVVSTIRPHPFSTQSVALTRNTFWLNSLHRGTVVDFVLHLLFNITSKGLLRTSVTPGGFITATSDSCSDTKKLKL